MFDSYFEAKSTTSRTIQKSSSCFLTTTPSTTVSWTRKHIATRPSPRLAAYTRKHKR
jgi:hypothetical protein